MTVGESPARLVDEPVLTQREKTAFTTFEEPGWIVFATADRIYRVGTDGQGLKELRATSKSYFWMQKIEIREE
jgi:hypothetical protein